ncbi:MAG: cytidylate kinase-like family protein [Ruminococcaceae bacterium]|nr:cytidylate kinase-like family protein [Oscillospiraceae bacterium]
MDKQVIITVGRETGSGGYEIAKHLGERLGITVYDKNIFEGIGEQFNIDTSALEKFDEKPRKMGITRKVNGYSNSPEEQVVELQRKFLREKAEKGESFIIMGRAGIKTLLDFPCLLIRIFVTADEEFKIERLCQQSGYSRLQAQRYMIWNDSKRKSYHNQFCHVKWGDPASYDIIVKGNKMGLEATADMLAEYVRRRMEQA